MARTFRRMDAQSLQESKTWYNDEIYINYRVGYVENTEALRNEYIRKHHSDGHFDDGWRSSYLKRETNRNRRANQRNQLIKVYKLTDYEDARYDDSYEDYFAKMLIWMVY